MSFKTVFSSLRRAFPGIPPNVGSSTSQSSLCRDESRNTRTSEMVLLCTGKHFLIVTSRKVGKKRELTLGMDISHPALLSSTIIPIKEKKKGIKYPGSNVIHRWILSLWKYFSVSLSCGIPSSINKSWQICSHKKLYIKYKLIYWTCFICFRTSRRQLEVA